MRDDVERQMRIPIAAAACQCDEDWHPGKLSLKLVFFRYLSIKQSEQKTKMPGVVWKRAYAVRGSWELHGAVELILS